MRGSGRTTRMILEAVKMMLSGKAVAVVLLRLDSLMLVLPKILAIFPAVIFHKPTWTLRYDGAGHVRFIEAGHGGRQIKGDRVYGYQERCTLVDHAVVEGVEDARIDQLLRGRLTRRDEATVVSSAIAWDAVRRYMYGGATFMPNTPDEFRHMYLGDWAGMGPGAEGGDRLIILRHKPNANPSREQRFEALRAEGKKLGEINAILEAEGFSEVFGEGVMPCPTKSHEIVRTNQGAKQMINRLEVEP